MAAAGQQVSFQVRFPEVGKVNIRHSLQQQHQAHSVLCTAYTGRKLDRRKLDAAEFIIGGFITDEFAGNVFVQQAAHLSGRQRQLMFRRHARLEIGEQAVFTRHLAAVHPTVVQGTKRTDIGGNRIVTLLPVLQISLKMMQGTPVHAAPKDGAPTDGGSECLQGITIDISGRETALLPKTAYHPDCKVRKTILFFHFVLVFSD